MWDSQCATRNQQLAMCNSQLATRNSQLATRNLQLAFHLVPPPHERFTTGTIEGAWSNLNNGLPVYDDWGKLVSSSEKRKKFRHTIIRQFRKGNQSIWEGIPIPDLLIVSYFYRVSLPGWEHILLRRSISDHYLRSC